MRSKIFQKVLDDYNSKPFYYKIKVELKLLYYIIKTIGLVKFLKIKLSDFKYK